ncbi:hypothetical protein Q7C36_013887 [Tachysurus vachellii]|uniref:Uncharacterized protein n=1 Tax=Tachysurus vachellii TaxID=175792 RepID=A0AA88SQ07_TACVA|nr:hypothetical protein Q7C36_013887 [Tachysurus vachellii]
MVLGSDRSLNLLKFGHFLNSSSSLKNSCSIWIKTGFIQCLTNLILSPKFSSSIVSTVLRFHRAWHPFTKTTQDQTVSAGMLKSGTLTSCLIPNSIGDEEGIFTSPDEKQIRLRRD